MIKFWEPAKQYAKHREEILAKIDEVLSSGMLVLGGGTYAEDFERDFAKFLGVKHAIACGGGTHALLLAYRALDIGPGDEVIVPSNTFVATMDQVALLGATPVLVDCDEDGLMDLSHAIASLTDKTKAIVPVHMEGKVVPAFAATIPIIEDAAQAIGAKNVGYGIMQCYSLYPAKVLGSKGNLGVVTTNDDELARKIRLDRCNGLIGKNPDLDAPLGCQLEPDNDDVAVAHLKLKYLPEVLRRRSEVAAMYDEGLRGLPIKLPLKQEGRIYQDYMIQTPDRDKLKDVLDILHGVQCLVPNPRIPNNHYTVLKKDLPNTDRYIATKLALPCNDTITDEEVRYIIQAIRDFYLSPPSQE